MTATLRSPDRWRPVALSLVLHGALAGAAVSLYLWAPPRQPPVQPLAIEATVVDARAVGLRGTQVERIAPAPEPAPEPPPQPAPEPPPQPAPEPAPVAQTPPVPAEQPDEAVRRAAERLAQERAEEEARQAAEARQAEAARAAAERQRRIEESRRAAEKAAADAKATAEAQRRVLEQQEAKLRAQREADLRRQLETEARANAARASGLGASWAAAIQARVQRAWIRPPTAQTGLDCLAAVTQVPGGEVTSVRILSCNGDDIVRQSIEDAIYRASPLPPPPDPALFERSIELRFRPND